MEENFSVEDVLSLYLTGQSKAWVEEKFHKEPKEFISVCARYPKVNITNNAVAVAKYMEEKNGVRFFPHMIKAQTKTLGRANWRIDSFDGKSFVYSEIPIAVVVDYIKQGKVLKIVTHPKGEKTMAQITGVMDLPTLT